MTASMRAMLAGSTFVPMTGSGLPMASFMHSTEFLKAQKAIAKGMDVVIGTFFRVFHNQRVVIQPKGQDGSSFACVSFGTGREHCDDVAGDVVIVFSKFRSDRVKK